MINTRPFLRISKGGNNYQIRGAHLTLKRTLYIELSGYEIKDITKGGLHLFNTFGEICRKDYGSIHRIYKREKERCLLSSFFKLSN